MRFEVPLRGGSKFPSVGVQAYFSVAPIGTVTAGTARNVGLVNPFLHNRSEAFVHHLPGGRGQPHRPALPCAVAVLHRSIRNTRCNTRCNPLCLHTADPSVSRDRDRLGAMRSCFVLRPCRQRSCCLSQVSRDVVRLICISSPSFPCTVYLKSCHFNSRSAAVSRVPTLVQKM